MMKKLLLLCMCVVAASVCLAQQIPFEQPSTGVQALLEWVNPSAASASPAFENHLRRHIHERAQRSLIKQLCTPGKEWGAMVRLRSEYEKQVINAEVYCSETNPDIAFVIAFFYPNDNDMKKIEILQVNPRATVSAWETYVEADTRMPRFGEAPSDKPSEMPERLESMRRYVRYTLQYDYQTSPEQISAQSVSRPFSYTIFGKTFADTATSRPL